MFEQLISIGELLISGLSVIPLSKNKRKVIGKTLSSLHRDLTSILRNGDKILRLFRRHNNGKNVNVDDLKVLLEEQNYLIPLIIYKLRNKDISTILSIKAPQITPLQVALFAKGSRVKFYLNKIDTADARRADSTNFRWIHTDARIELPDNKAIDYSRKQLGQIETYVEELRKFIVDNFEVDDII
jgi:hypothetical protein